MKYTHWVIKKFCSLILNFTLAFPINVTNAATISPGAVCSKSKLGKTKFANGLWYACWYTKTTRSEVNNSQKWNLLPKGFSIPKGSKFYGGDIKGEASTVFLQFNEKAGERTRWVEAIISTTQQLLKGGWSCPSAYKIGTMVFTENFAQNRDFSVASRVEKETDNLCPVVYSQSSGKLPQSFLSSMIKGDQSVSINGYYQNSFPHFLVALNFNGAPAKSYKVDCSQLDSTVGTNKITTAIKSDLIEISLDLSYEDLLYKFYGFLPIRACLSGFRYEIGVMTSSPYRQTSQNQYAYEPKYELFETFPITSWQNPLTIPSGNLVSWLGAKGVDTSKNPVALAIRFVNPLSNSQKVWIIQSCVTNFVTTQSDMPWCSDRNS